MRSYWALLCHILGSHPEIAGYAEMHLAYRHVFFGDGSASHSSS